MMEPDQHDIRLWQKQFEFVTCDARHTAFIAGIGSGKSIAGAAKMVREMMQSGGTGMIVAPTYQMLRDASLDSLRRVGGTLIKSMNRSDMSCEWVNGARTIMRSADDPEHLRGPNISALWIDEGSQIKRDAWLILLGRAREGAGRIWVTTTPRGLTSWLYDEFVLNPQPDTRVIHAETRENPYLPAEFLRDVTERFSGAYAQQELGGQFVNVAVGLVYGDLWDDSKNVTVEAEYRPDGGPVYWAVDDGYAGEWDNKAGMYTATSHPRVFLLCQLRPGGSLAVFAESHAVKRLSDEHINEVLALPYPKPESVAVDQSAAELKGRLHAHGIYTVPGPRSVEESIKVMRGWVGPDANSVRRLIVHPRCGQLRKEFTRYRYDEANGKVVKEHDHFLDALRYLTWSLRHEQ